MNHTELIKSIKNKLKKHQYKIDVLNKTIDLDTKIKNDLETNFNELSINGFDRFFRLSTIFILIPYILLLLWCILSSLKLYIRMSFN